MKAVSMRFRHFLPSRWWHITLRGVLAVLFGVATLMWPGLTLAVLILLFGAFAMAYGVIALVNGFHGDENRSVNWLSIIEGVVAIGIGLVTFFWPAITLVALVYIIAVWALITGMIELMAAVSLRRFIRGEWLLALAGVLSIIVGVLLILFPTAGAFSVVLVIGAYAVAFGILLIALGLRLRTLSPAEGTRSL